MERRSGQFVAFHSTRTRYRVQKVLIFQKMLHSMRPKTQTLLRLKLYEGRTRRNFLYEQTCRHTATSDKMLVSPRKWDKNTNHTRISVRHLRLLGPHFGKLSCRPPTFKRQCLVETRSIQTRPKRDLNSCCENVCLTCRKTTSSPTVGHLMVRCS